MLLSDEDEALINMVHREY